MSLVSRISEATPVETPAATMRPVVGPSTELGCRLAGWWSELRDGTSGPLHTIDGDQLVIVADGEVEIRVEGECFTVGPGDALVLPAGAARVIRSAGGPARTFTIGYPQAVARVGDGEPVVVPWTA